MIYLANAFSLGMLRYPDINEPHRLQITRISAFEAGEILHRSEFYSVYGHRDTACHLAKYLKIYVPVQRETIELKPGDVMIVARANVRRMDYEIDRRRGPKWSFFRVTVGGDDAVQ